MYRYLDNNYQYNTIFKSLKECLNNLKNQIEYDKKYNQFSSYILQKFDGYEWHTIKQ